MKRTGFIKIVSSAVCIALAVYLAVSSVFIYREGMTRRASDPSASVYTPEAVRQKLLPALPAAAAILLLTAAGRKHARNGLHRQEEPDCRMPAGAIPRRAAPIRGVMLAAALILLLCGILNGSARDVMIKAIMICTECIGIG